MANQNALTTEELLSKLLDIQFHRFHGGSPDITMLRDSFQNSLGREERKKAKRSFEIAIEVWSDNQIAEFIDIVSEKQASLPTSSEDLRNVLIRIYKEIFDRK